MMRLVPLALVALCSLSCSVEAFIAPKVITSRVVQSASPSVRLIALAMAAEGDEPSKLNDDGTVYDDEVDTEPVKDGISDNMKARLMAEASAGLDPDSKQQNTILYIMAAVAVLVVAGGQGILY